MSIILVLLFIPTSVSTLAKFAAKDDVGLVVDVDVELAIKAEDADSTLVVGTDEVNSDVGDNVDAE